MKHNDFDCEVITPMFLAGSEARGAPPEIRAPSLRGAMRYWFRAMAGNAAASIQELHVAESAVFGAAESGGPVAVVAHPGGEFQIDEYQKDGAIRTPAGDFLPTGKDYLFWSMASTGRPDTSQFKPARQSIRPGVKFRVSLRSRLGGNVLQQASAALWLLSNLGGLGARSGRAAGSFEAAALGALPARPDFKTCSSPEMLAAYLAQGLAQCLEVIAGVGAAWKPYPAPPEYDVLSPSSAEVWVVTGGAQAWNTYLDAVNGLGTKLRDYRSHRNPLGRADHDAVLDWLESGGAGPKIQRAVFGLPIPFRYSGGGPNDVIISEDSERRASPLHFHVTRLSSGKYVGVLTLFKSQFLEPGKKLELKTRRWEAPAPNNYSVIQNFIAGFGGKWRAL